MAAYEIPFEARPQAFSIALGEKVYRLATRWCEPMGAWGLDIYDADGPLLAGIPIVAGADLLGQHKHLGIPGAIFVQRPGDPKRNPTFDDLGSGGLVFFVTEA